MNHVVVFAGGVGSRMGKGSIPKQFLKLYGKPILIHTLEKFENCSLIDDIVVSCLSDWMPHLEKLIVDYGLKKVRKIVPGGKTGQGSIFNGLSALKEFVVSDDDIVLVHDGVRPLVDEELIKENIDSVKRFGSAITSSHVTETIVSVDKSDNINNIFQRADVRYAKAPQSFYFKDLFRAHEKALKDGKTNFIDSSSLMTYYGARLHVIDCSSDNVKVTTPKDYYVLKALLDSSENEKVFK